MNVTPSGRSASMTALVTAGERGDRAGLADALDAERVRRRRRLGAVGLEARELRRARQRVVDERAGDELAVVVVVDALVERLADRVAMPPCTWPSISIGLIAGPQSSTAT